MKHVLLIVSLLLLTSCALQRSLESAAQKADAAVDQTQALLAEVGRDYRQTVAKHDTNKDGTLDLTEIALGLAGLLGLGGARLASQQAKTKSELEARNAASDARKTEMEKREVALEAKVATLTEMLKQPRV